MGRKHGEVKLSPADKAALRGIVRKGSNKARVIKRAQILLLADNSDGRGKTYGEIQTRSGAYPSAISLVIGRYKNGGLAEALNERPRPGQAPKLTGEAEAKLITLACSAPPTGHARWTLQMLADELIALKVVDGITDTSIWNKLKKMKLSRGV